MEKLVHSTETLPIITINAGRQIVIGNVRPNVNLVKVTNNIVLKFTFSENYLRIYVHLKLVITIMVIAESKNEQKFWSCEVRFNKICRYC